MIASFRRHYPDQVVRVSVLSIRLSALGSPSIKYIKYKLYRLIISNNGGPVNRILSFFIMTCFPLFFPL